MEAPESRRVWTFVGLALLASAGVLHLRGADELGPLPPADVHLEILGPSGDFLLAAPVHADEGESTVLGVLLAAREIHQFSVDVNGQYVREIYGFAAQGTCGWVYRVGDAWGTGAASLARVHDGALVHWEWRCGEPG